MRKGKRKRVRGEVGREIEDKGAVKVREKEVEERREEEREGRGGREAEGGEAGKVRWE